MDPLAAIRETYFEECGDLLGALERCLQAFDAGATDAEQVHAAFRAIHSIKGGAGAFGFTALVTFAHAFENALDLVRSGGLNLQPGVVGLFLRAADMLADQVVAAREGSAPPDAAELVAKLEELAGPRAAAADLEAFFAAPAAAPEPASPVAPPPAPAATLCAGLRLQPGTDLFRRAIDPARLLGMLAEHARLTLRADLAALPGLAELAPEDCWLAWDVSLDPPLPAALLQATLGPFLDPLEYVLEPQGPAPAAGPVAALTTPAPAAAPLARAGASTASAVTAAEPPAGGRGPGEGRGAGSIRVELGRIDRLVNLVGEIVVTQAVLAEQVRLLPGERHAPLVEAVATLTRQARELQESVMAVRAQPVKAVFQRMPRLVRELATSLGKQARLVLTGELTEVDKTIIEELADPLTHMLRNAMDHGLEPPADRAAAGKPEEGTITLSAEQRGGRIVITVSDDGRGIDRDRLLAKAHRQGLVGDGARLPPEEIDALIFHPGLSTADKVSDVSGRGVGMDVVKRSIQAMGGRITVTSEPGRGCRFTLALPLTLAVLDGMVLRVGSERYVVPLQSVVETLRVEARLCDRLPGGREILRLRDRLAPLVDLRRIIGCGTPPPRRPDEGIVIVAETDHGQRLGLLVDEIMGQQQVVVKSLEQSYGAIAGIAGASILGDGRVSLILDVDALPMLAGEPRPLPSPPGPLEGLAA